MKDYFLNLWDDLSEWAKQRWTQVLVPIGLASITGLLVQSPFEKEVALYKSGEIAASDIKAPLQILVVDEELTKRKGLAAEESVPDVYDFDSQLEQNIASRITEAFEAARQSNSSDEKKVRKTFEEKIGFSLSDQQWTPLMASKFNRPTQSALEYLIQEIFGYWIYDHLNKETTYPDRKLIVRDLFTESEQELTYEELRSRSLDFAGVKEKLAELASPEARSFRRISAPVQIALVEIAEKLIDSNLSFNQIETNARRQEARASVEPVVVEIAKGEMIVREGQRVERKHVLLLEGLRKEQSNRTNFRSYVGFVSLFFVLVFVFHWVGVKNFRRFRLSSRDRIILGSFFVLGIALITGLNFLFEASRAQSFSSVSLSLLLPFAFPGMTLRLFTSIEITFIFSILFHICTAWLLKDPFIGLTGLLVCMAGASAMRHISQRLDVLKAGLLTGLIQSLCILLGVIIGLTESAGFESPWVNLIGTAAFCFGSGLISSALVLVSQPIIEFLGYTTDLRLMELSNTNHPLLRELIMKAPGSYFHSFTVGQLSEKAAEAINANPLFARVASLYHDVGKLKKPQYFIENIKGENKHDKLVPSMSALIISNHVKEGIELAQQYNLPQSIIDVIPQHHGTSLISFFYEKARKSSGDEEVDERDFRYPGPKPQTKEAGIIMLADAVEATAKSMPQASLDQLRQKVNQTIRRFFLDGQLDECELSLKDLNSIGEAFVQVLQGIYHQRIDYPHLKETTQDIDTQAITATSKIIPDSRS